MEDDGCLREGRKILASLAGRWNTRFRLPCRMPRSKRPVWTTCTSRCPCSQSILGMLSQGCGIWGLPDGMSPFRINRKSFRCWMMYMRMRASSARSTRSCGAGKSSSDTTRMWRDSWRDWKLQDARRRESMPSCWGQAERRGLCSGDSANPGRRILWLACGIRRKRKRWQMISGDTEGSPFCIGRITFLPRRCPKRNCSSTRRPSGCIRRWTTCRPWS